LACWGLKFGMLGSGSWGLEFGVWGLEMGFGIWGLGLGFGVWGWRLCLRGSSLLYRVEGSSVKGLGFRA
jgi:hypothetical protein